MPRLNSLGEYAMGIAGIQGSVNGILVPDSYGPYWVNNDEVIFGQPSNLRLTVMNIRNSSRRVAIPNSSYNELRAGGHNWAGFIAVPALLFAPNLNLPNAYLHDVGPDGAIGFRTNYHSDFGVEVFELNGERWTLNTTDIVYDLQLLGNKRAIWKNQIDHKIRTHNLPSCVQVGNAWRPRATFINGEWWVCYESDIAGLILHPFNSTIGYVIVPPGVSQFNHDAIAINVFEKVAWSTTQGELPEHYRDKIVDVTTDPRQELGSHTELIVNINRPHWLGFFTGQSNVLGGWDTNDDPPEFQDAHSLPGNGYLDVPTSTFYNYMDEPIGFFIHQQPGWTVETIEEEAKNIPFIPIVYWDSRNWPRWPNLPANSWLCIQAYCRRDESFVAFEADIRGKLIDLRQNKPQQKVAIIAQAYWQTPVNSHTDDLSGLVPIYSRLAAEFPNVIATIPFNGNGRFGGMQNHPEIRPLWEQFAAGITGEPSMPEQEIPDEFDIVLSINNQFPHLLQINSRETCGEFTEKVVCELAKKDSRWGHVGKQPGQNQHNGHAVDAVMYESTSTTRNVRDIIIASGTGNPTNPSWGEEENGGQPWMEPIDCEDEPVPVEGKIDILAFDPVCRRSDPNGCLIRFDIQSPNPVVEAEFDLEGDGEPGVPIFFSNEPRRDGRYVRGFAFKFTVNGTWILRVTAKDDQGNIYRSNGQQIITVTF